MMPREGNDVTDAAIVSHNRCRRDFHRKSYPPISQLTGTVRSLAVKTKAAAGMLAGSLHPPLIGPKHAATRLRHTIPTPGRPSPSLGPAYAEIDAWSTP